MPSAEAWAAIEVRDAEEVGDEQRCRLLVDELRRPGLLDAAVVHHRDAIAHRERLFLVVRDEHEGDADLGLQRLQLDLEVLAQPCVEGAERLVEEKHAGPEDERAGERDALLLAARELARLAAPERAELDDVEDLGDALALLLLRHALVLQPEGDVVGDDRCGNSA